MNIKKKAQKMFDYPRDCTLHFDGSRRWCGAVVICCYAGINTAVLGHQIADFQGDFPGITRDTKRMPFRLQ